MTYSDPSDRVPWTDDDTAAADHDAALEREADWTPPHGLPRPDVRCPRCGDNDWRTDDLFGECCATCGRDRPQ